MGKAQSHAMTLPQHTTKGSTNSAAGKQTNLGEQQHGVPNHHLQAPGAQHEELGHPQEPGHPSTNQAIDQEVACMNGGFVPTNV